MAVELNNLLPQVRKQMLQITLNNNCNHLRRYLGTERNNRTAIIMKDSDGQKRRLLLLDEE